MSYKVTYSKLVLKSILKYDKPTRERIYRALDNLPFGDIKNKKTASYYKIRDG